MLSAIDPLTRYPAALLPRIPDPFHSNGIFLSVLRGLGSHTGGFTGSPTQNTNTSILITGIQHFDDIRLVPLA